MRPEPLLVNGHVGLGNPCLPQGKGRSRNAFWPYSSQNCLQKQGRPSIARVERAHSYRARSASRRTARRPFPTSETACCTSTRDHLVCLLTLFPHSLTFFSREDGLFGLPLRASNEGSPRPRVARAKEANRPPSHSSHFPLHRPQGEQPDCPSLRASDEHLLSVRVLRARRMVWLLPSHSSFDRPPPSRL